MPPIYHLLQEPETAIDIGLFFGGRVVETFRRVYFLNEYLLCGKLLGFFMVKALIPYTGWIVHCYGRFVKLQQNVLWGNTTI